MGVADGSGLVGYFEVKGSGMPLDDELGVLAQG